MSNPGNLSDECRRPQKRLTLTIHALFLLSGISALLYQVTWQRSLMLIYGCNIESVAMVVSAFLVGLGMGSLLGGYLSKWNQVLLFASAEMLIGIYGLVSLRLFAWVGHYTLTAGQLVTGLLVFSLVFLPTLLMGATLPLLVAHQIGQTRHVGSSVTWLYCVNTLGGAAGAFLAAFFVLGAVGLSGAAQCAAALNGTAAILMFLLGGRQSRGLPR